MAQGYQHSPAFNSGTLQVDDVHTLYFEEFGKKDGKPVLYLHGGPGGSCSIRSTVFFNPQIYRVINLDQRGCGKSTPHASTHDNDPQHLCSDLEAIRKHLSIPKWHMVFGGSWGACLGLLYAETHPESVGSLVLRSLCVLQTYEVEFISSAVESQFPELWAEMTAFLSPEQRRGARLAQAYHDILHHSEDQALRRQVAMVWQKMGHTLITMQPVAFDDAFVDVDIAAMASRFFVNNGWFEDGQLLKQANVDRIRHIPTSVVSGRWDILSPPRVSYEFHQKFPESKLYMVPGACHTFTEPGLFAKLLEVCDEYAQLDLS